MLQLIKTSSIYILQLSPEINERKSEEFLLVILLIKKGETVHNL